MRRLRKNLGNRCSPSNDPSRPFCRRFLSITIKFDSLASANLVTVVRKKKGLLITVWKFRKFSLRFIFKKSLESTGRFFFQKESKRIIVLLHCVEVLFCVIGYRLASDSNQIFHWFLNLLLSFKIWLKFSNSLSRSWIHN